MADEILNEQVEEQVDDTTSGEDDLIAALKSLADSEEVDSDEEVEDTQTDETDNDNEQDSDADDEEEQSLEEEEEEKEEEPKKKAQSKEKNAEFAAKRRQAEMEQRVQAELERLKKESPDFKLAEKLSKIYGKSTDQILSELQEAELQKQAEERKVPVEQIKKEQQDSQELAQLKEEMNRLKFDAWKSKIDADKVRLKTDYNVLGDSDLDEAVQYVLRTNVDMPLEQAVYALHGKKIIEALATAKEQEKLAAESGRKKKTPLAPNNGKASQAAKSITAEEKYIAQQLGMSVDDYLKYKS